MIRKRRVLAMGVSLYAAAAIALPAENAAAAIPAGFDLFETDPQNTHVDFQGPTTIPAGFFDPGSDPFTGTVKLGGQPLGTFNGLASGDADTVVQRLAPANVFPGGPPQNVPIEIVQLSLVSIEPITVTYAGHNPQMWDVTVTLQPPQQQGQMQITQTTTEGGTFTSQLPVRPLLTFTRLSDGAQRGLTLTPIPYQSQSTPWRAGCDLPALRIIGINDLFCPGLTPDKRKQLTLEQFLFASHAVYPVQPNLEHFKCYKLRKQGFKGRKVTLADQFGQRTTKVKRRAEFCNPVQKNQEPFLNQRAHLQCYKIGGPILGAQVAVRNQFGSQRLLVRNPQRLCVPTEKKELSAKRILPLPARDIVQIKVKKTPKISVPIDHFQCYGVQATTPLRARALPGPLTLVDQFHRETVQLLDPFRLCTPTVKNKGFTQHPVRHLVCYRFRAKKFQRPFGIQNQFEQRVLITRKPQALCVPSLKTRF